MRAAIAVCLIALSPVPAAADAPFMTSAEVRPIMEMTRANWVAIREWEGQDLVYFTHLESMRCGISAVHFGLNGAPAETEWKLAECDRSKPNPNEIDVESHMIYAVFGLKSVETISVVLDFDDGTSLTADFARAAVMTP